jgi:hypothetical protein
MGIGFDNNIVRYHNLAIVSAGVNSSPKGRVIINNCIIKYFWTRCRVRDRPIDSTATAGAIFRYEVLDDLCTRGIHNPDTATLSTW